MCIPSFGLKYFLVLLGTSTLLILSIHLWPNWVHGPLSVYTYCSCELTHCWQFPNLYPPSGPLPSTPDFYCQQPTQFLHLEVKHNVLKTALGYPPQTNHSQRALAQWMATPLWHTIALSPLPQSWLGNPIGRSYLQNKSGPFLTTSSTANSITWVPVSTLDHALPFSYFQHTASDSTETQVETPHSSPQKLPVCPIPFRAKPQSLQGFRQATQMSSLTSWATASLVLCAPCSGLHTVPAQPPAHFHLKSSLAPLPGPPGAYCLLQESSSAKPHS